MVEFEGGEQMRFLPCLHAYHKDCIDDWLMRSFTCPSCMEPVDAALLSSFDGWLSLISYIPVHPMLAVTPHLLLLPHETYKILYTVFCAILFCHSRYSHYFIINNCANIYHCSTWKLSALLIEVIVLFNSPFCCNSSWCLLQDFFGPPFFYSTTHGVFLHIIWLIASLFLFMFSDVLNVVVALVIIPRSTGNTLHW